MEEYISESIKNQLYVFFGFEFNCNKNFLNYDDVFDAITLGSVFEEICTYLELDPDILSKHVKNYVLHLISEEITSISLEEKILMQRFGHLWSDEEEDDDSTVDIVSNYFDNPTDYFELYSHEYLCELLDIEIPACNGHEGNPIVDREINMKLTKRVFSNLPEDYSLKNKYKEILGNIEFSYDATDYHWHSNSRISGSLYRSVLRSKLNDGHMTLTRQPRFIINKQRNKDDSDKFFLNAVNKTNLFLKCLEQQFPVHSPTQELLLFEKDTNMLFLMENSLLSYGANRNYNSPKYSSNGLRILSSFILIEDINIRSYFSKTYYNEAGMYMRFLHHDGFYYFFLFNHILLPLLAMFVRTELALLVSPKGIRRIDSQIHHPQLKSKLIKLYRKDSINRLVNNPNKPSLTQFKNILSCMNRFKDSETVQKQFIELYFKIGDMKNLINQNKKSGENFSSLIVSEPLKWYRRNKNEILKDIKGAVEHLAITMAEEFISRIGLNSTRPAAKPSIEQLIENIDSYYAYLNNQEDVKKAHDKIISELNNRGWNF